MLVPLLTLVATYFSFMHSYLERRPHVPPTEFDEREWLAFRAIFLKVYRAKEVTLSPQQRVLVTKVNVQLKGCSKLCVTKGRASCFVPDLMDEALPTGWDVSARSTTSIGMHGLGVGSFAWWGQADKLITINSPQKKVISLSNLNQILMRFTEH